MSKTQSMSFLAMLSAMAIVLNMIENMLALPLGVRIGMANIMALIVVHIYGVKEMIFVNLLRVVVSGLLSGIILSYPWWMSVGGVTLSSLMLMTVYKHSSFMFTGVMCAIAHSVGQILVLSFFLTSSAFMPYLGIMIIMSIITGILTGKVSEIATKRLKRGINHAS